MHPSTAPFLPERSRDPSRASDMLLGVIAGLILAFGTRAIVGRQPATMATPPSELASSEPKVQWSTVNLVGYQVRNGN